MTAKPTYKNIPALRFPEFENVGEWKVVKFKDIFTMLSNNTLSRAELSEKDGLALNVHYGDVLIKFGERLDLNNDNLPHIKDDEILHKYKSSYLEDGDVIFADTAEDETAGKCTEIRNIGKQIVISGLHTIPCRPKNEFAPYYWGYYLNSNIYHTKLLPLMQGAKVTSISRSSLQETTVVYPPTFPEQQKIAAFLTSLDEQISAHTKKLEALKAHKKGLMQKLFPTKGKTIPEIRFKEFEKDGEWVEKKLREVVDVFQGYGFPEKMQGKKQGMYPFIKVSDISAMVNNGKMYIDCANNYVDEEDLSLLGAIPFPIGTVVFAKIGEAIRLNRRVILSKPSLIDNNVGGVKAKTFLSDDNFVFYIMSMIDLVKYAGGVVPAVKKTTIENIEVLIPPTLDEQRKIADAIMSVDRLIESKIKNCSLLIDYKKGLMQRMFLSVETPYYDVSAGGGKPTETPCYDVSTVIN